MKHAKKMRFAKNVRVCGILYKGKKAGSLVCNNCKVSTVSLVVTEGPARTKAAFTQKHKNISRRFDPIEETLRQFCLLREIDGLESIGYELWELL